MSITNCMSAVERFFSAFGLPVYPEDNVPDRDAEGEPVRPPYITVQLTAPTWQGKAPFFARLWYRATDYQAIAAKADEIAEAIGEGASVPIEGGALYLYREDPFCQFQPFPGDPTLKSAYLSMSLINLTN